MEMNAYVYILSSGFKRLYIGVTSDLENRVRGHKNGLYPGSFTDRYHIHQLVYFERFGDIRRAIAREKQLKRWSRIKKIRLIVGFNPDWRDLSLEWGTPVAPFREPGEGKEASASANTNTNTGVSPLRITETKA